MIIDQIHDSVGKYRMGVILEVMPDFIKENHDKIASENLSNLSDGLFAYSNGVDRYFPINSPGQAALSKGYFEKCANEFNEQEREVIRKRIDNALEAFGVENISIPLEKEASQEDEIDYIHSLSKEIFDFVENYKKLKIEKRRELAKQLVEKAIKLKKSSGLPDLVNRYGGNKLHHDFVKNIAERAKFLKEGSPERSSLITFQDRAKELDPETLAKAIAIFDRKFNLDRHYDTELNDPYYGLLDHGKIDETPIHVIGENELYKSELDGFDFSKLNDLFEDGKIEEFKNDGLEALKKLDTPLRIIVIKRIKNG